MKLFLLIAVTCTINSCHDSTAVQRIQEDYIRDRDACVAHGGVPIEGEVKDDNTTNVYRTVMRCDWPKKAEQP